MVAVELLLLAMVAVAVERQVYTHTTARFIQVELVAKALTVETQTLQTEALVVVVWALTAQPCLAIQAAVELVELELTLTQLGLLLLELVTVVTLLAVVAVEVSISAVVVLAALAVEAMGNLTPSVNPQQLEMQTLAVVAVVQPNLEVAQQVRLAAQEL